LTQIWLVERQRKGGKIGMLVDGSGEMVGGCGSLVGEWGYFNGVNLMEYKVLKNGSLLVKKKWFVIAKTVGQ
jgi:hypothetical protein